DLAKPLIYSKIDFYPIDTKGKHFYIYEPTQLLNGTLVIPIFFYSFHGELYVKCIRPQTTGHVSRENLKLLIPHPLPYNLDQMDFLWLICLQKASGVRDGFDYIYHLLFGTKSSFLTHGELRQMAGCFDTFQLLCMLMKHQTNQ
ncbi:uncharacterized protein VP01_9399g1, partial [Puccinia sorghi]